MADPEHDGKPILNIPENRKGIARYLWSVFTEATHFRDLDFPESPFIIETSGRFPITASFDDFLAGHIDRVARKYGLPEGLSTFRQEEPLACAFYLLNSLHERLISPDELDRYGRYPYSLSIQYANEITEINFVQDILDDIYRGITNRSPVREDSAIFWTHDIDYLYSAWKSDLIQAARSANFSDKIKWIRRALTQPHRWNNVESLLALEKQYGIQSVFFWLTEHGKAPVKPTHRIDHADYSLQSARIKKLWKCVTQAGSVNGLHKSAYDRSFQDEIRKTPASVIINRNHFLRFRLPDHYDRVERAGLSYDASLGFAEHHGFRNSFGRPFQPYNLAENRPYQFWEYPLHLMDTTFLTYLGQDLETMIDSMIHFVHRHRQACTLSLLIHNTQINFKDTSEMKIWYRLFQALKDMPVLDPQKFKKKDLYC